MGCYLRIDDEAVVVKLHKMFGSFGTTTCGVIEDGVYHADVPLKPDDVDFLDEVARRWSRAGESMLVIFNYDVDYILTLSKHPLDWLTKPDPPNENGRDRS